MHMYTGEEPTIAHTHIFPSNNRHADPLTSSIHPPVTQQWVARQLCEEAYLHGSLDNAAAIVVDLRNHAAHDCYHYYDCKEERAQQQHQPAAVVGGGPPVGLPAEAAVEGVATPGKAGEEEGGGLFGDRGEEGVVSLALMERQFRQVVTVRMRPGASGCGGVDSDTSGSGGSWVGKGAQSEEAEDENTEGKQFHQEERLPPLTTAASTTLSSCKRGGLGTLLQRRASRHGSAGRRNGGGGSWSPEKKGGALEMKS